MSSPAEGREKREERNESVVACRLREAYAAVDGDVCSCRCCHPPCAASVMRASPSLRDLFTVTLNMDVLLRRREVDALVAIRQRRLRWYGRIFHALHGAYEIGGLLRYWVRGVVVYEFREMDRCMGNDTPRPRRREGDEEEDAERETAEDVVGALEHAVELRQALRRFPRLVDFLFSGKLREREATGFDAVINDAVRACANSASNVHLLQRLLKTALQYRRRCSQQQQCELLTTVHTCDGHHDSQGCPRHRILGNFHLDICELIELFSRNKQLAKDCLVVTILQSVVSGCHTYFQRESLLRLLEPATGLETRHAFFARVWPRYWNSELEMMRELPYAEEAWTKRVLVNLVFLWDVGSDSEHKHNTSRVPLQASPLDLRRFYLFQLLQLTLRPLFDRLFFLDVPQDESALLSAAEEEMSTTPEGRMGVTCDALAMLLEIANAMACVDVPPQQPFRLWNQIGAGPALPCDTAKNVGFFIMANVCREQLDALLTHAVNHFLSSTDILEEQRWPRLFAYLLRTECAFHRLCDVCLLNARLVDSSSGVACFFSILKSALLNHCRRQQNVDVLVDALLDSIHTYLMPGRRGSSSGHTAAAAMMSLSNREEMMSAIRLGRGVSSTDEFLRLYKELLAHRLLSPAAGRAATEKSVCEHLRELFPQERSVIRQIIQMCVDMEEDSETHETCVRQEPQQQAGGEEASVKLTVRVLSRLAWPAYTTLTNVPRPLQNAMDQFAAAYHSQHHNRRVVWLYTTMETITFTVAYPQGEKIIVGSLELFNIFHHLSEAGREGTTWALLFQHFAKEKKALQREVLKLVSDGFLSVRQKDNEEWISVNTSFASRQLRHRFVRPLSRVGSLSEERRRMLGGVNRSHVLCTQAAVIKQMKSVRACSYDELFCLTVQSIHQFQLQHDAFKAALEVLLEKGYIERDKTNRQRFIYKS